MSKSIFYWSSADGRNWLLAMLMTAVMTCCSGNVAVAQNSNSNRLTLGAGLLYERGLDATVAVEHETRYHNMWEYFASGYLKWDTDPEAGRNHFGNLRIGGGGGSDLHEFIGLVTVGYEHTYVMRGGWCLYFKVKEDVCIAAKDLFRTGVEVGIKLPLTK